MRSSRSVTAACLIALAACSGSTEPKPVQAIGTLTLASIDGGALPHAYRSDSSVNPNTPGRADTTDSRMIIVRERATFDAGGAFTNVQTWEWILTSSRNRFIAGGSYVPYIRDDSTRYTGRWSRIGNNILALRDVGSGGTPTASDSLLFVPSAQGYALTRRITHASLGPTSVQRFDYAHQFVKQ